MYIQIRNSLGQASITRVDLPMVLPRVLSYSTQDVIDSRISVPAQHSLVRLSKNPATSADAVGMLAEIKSGRLAGIYCVNWETSAQRALRLGASWWTVIPQGEDAVLLLDPDNPVGGQPLIAFRRELDPSNKYGCGKLKTDTMLTSSPARLDAALLKAWSTYRLWQTGQLASCGSQPSFNIPVKNLMPPEYCKVREDQPPSDSSIKLTPHPLLYYVWSIPRHRQRKLDNRWEAPKFGSLSQFDPVQCSQFDDHRNPVHATLTVPFRFICSLCVDFGVDPNNPTDMLLANGSGILVSPRHVLTCAHVVQMLSSNKDKTGWKVGSLAHRVFVVPARNHAAKRKINRLPRGILETQRIRVSNVFSEAKKQGRLITDPELLQFDYALLTLKKPIDRKNFGFWGTFGSTIRTTTENEIRNKLASIAGYPADKCLLKPASGSATREMLRNCFLKSVPPVCEDSSCKCLLSNIASTEWSVSSTVVNSSAGHLNAPRTLLLEAVVCGGMSGSPIWIKQDKEFVLIGILQGKELHETLTLTPAIRIHNIMLSEMRKWIQDDGEKPSF